MGQQWNDESDYRRGAGRYDSTARQPGRQGPPSDPNRDGCGPAVLCALAFIMACVVLLLAGCNSGPSLEACKLAMSRDMDKAVMGEPTPNKPPACDGVPDAELNRMLGELITERLDNLK